MITTNNNHININHNMSSSPTISFATHNVKSLQCEHKNISIYDTFLHMNTDFVGLQETWHKSDQAYHCSRDPNYLSFWSTPINTRAGVGLLVKYN